jgi:excisionase family DNA binding protein
MDELKLSELFVSITQAASLSHVNRVTITRWIKTGKLTGERIGLTTLIPRQDVLTLIKQRESKTFGAKGSFEAKPLSRERGFLFFLRGKGYLFNACFDVMCHCER